MNKIIEISSLGKEYKLGANKERYLSLRDSLTGMFSAKNKKKNTFWALDDVSFDVYAGDSIGIIGKNGAGKSTLLKILSRITPPTTGNIQVHGRIASLLEVGTGFHPELSGRENIYLNGSILGMKRSEIKSKFDEIVAFSGVEKFIDTSVKHYSSGMYVRLAFAVAAHLEPEVLIVDEVLAVGDAEFQKKCLGKMEQVSKEQGRTVLFVSHNMGAIQNLCTKAIVLHKGKLIANTDVNSGIKIYNESINTELSASRTYKKEKLDTSLPIEILSVALEPSDVSPEFYDIAENIYINMS
jgi:lipopolysaccharide transport system ATP-binding protein